jgi:hypothetical protein
MLLVVGIFIFRLPEQSDPAADLHIAPKQEVGRQ